MVAVLFDVGTASAKGLAGESGSDSDDELDAGEDSLDMNFSGGEPDDADAHHHHHHHDYINFHNAALYNATASASPSSAEEISFNS